MIDFRKYIRIISGVGAGAAIRTRDLILRLVTQHAYVSPGEVLEFSSATAVGAFFGLLSVEYLRARFYFAYISPSITAPRKISFIRYTPSAVAPKIFGDSSTKNLTTLQAVVAGSITFSFGGVAVPAVAGITFAAAASFAAVATALQTALRGSANAQLATCTVAYDNVTQRFNFTGGTAGAATIAITASSGGILAALGWIEAPTNDALFVAGGAVQTPLEAVAAGAEVSDNFGSFAFQEVLANADIVNIAAWNDAENVKYQYHVGTDAANAVTLCAALLGYGGVGVTISPLAVTDEYPELLPCAILAATDYSKRAASTNYMYRQASGLTPSVTTTTASDAFDAIRANYYGRTQTAGQNVDFYQRGTLMGGATDPVDMNVYGNEQWLKDAAGARLMELMLALSQLSANAAGRGQIITILQAVIDLALFNGTISAGKELTTVQKLYIGTITGDAEAWRQVQGIGYWVDCVMTATVTESGATEYRAAYTLIYSKNDAVRAIDGTHILI